MKHAQIHSVFTRRNQQTAMCREVEKLVNETRTDIFVKVYVDTVRNLVDSMSLSADATMQTLKVPEQFRESVKKLIE